MTTLAHGERLALADLLTEVGPDAPTLCGDWTTRDLAAHLVSRERRADALPGVAISALAWRTDSLRRSYARRPYADLVHLFRSGPGHLSLFSLPGVDRLLNATEHAVHHEDVRRAQPGWQPRDLPLRVQDSLWKAVTSRASLSFHGLDSRVVLRRSDRPEVEPSVHGSGDTEVTLTGAPMELLLFAFGRRDHAQVDVTGDPDAVSALAARSLAV
jgi:uncharacterized protein (TIGR03085 family)